MIFPDCYIFGCAESEKNYRKVVPTILFTFEYMEYEKFISSTTVQFIILKNTINLNEIRLSVVVNDTFKTDHCLPP